MPQPKQPDRPPVEQRVCRAILLLAEGRAPDEVAALVRISPKTLAAWQESSDFKVLLRRMREICLIENATQALQDLTPDAIDAYRRALSGPSVQWAVLAAREVLDRVERFAEREAQRQKFNPSAANRMEVLNPDGEPFVITPWAERNPVEPRALQSGSVRETLRQDGDGEDSDH